jgi:DNA-binding NarL/FixJ family response regulator
MSLQYQAAQSLAPAQPPKIRLVMIEDYKLVRIGLRMILGDDPDMLLLGEAEDGESGLELVQEAHPDLVLLDLGLPDIDGIELTRRIKKMDRNIKVLVLTSHEEEDEVAAALSAGANAYCMKDTGATRLLEVIRAVNEGAMWLDPRVAARALDVFSQDAIRVHVRRSEMSLTEREREVLRLIVEGMSNSEIAKALGISVHTAKAHVCSILQKLSVADRVQAAVKAVQENLV